MRIYTIVYNNSCNKNNYCFNVYLCFSKKKMFALN